MRIIARQSRGAAAEGERQWQHPHSDEIYASSAEKSSKSVADCDADCTELRGNGDGSGNSDGSGSGICHANCVRDKSCQLNYNVACSEKR